MDFLAIVQTVNAVSAIVLILIGSAWLKKQLKQQACFFSS